MSALWKREPGRLWSLWDMIKFDAGRFHQLLKWLSNLEGVLGYIRGQQHGVPVRITMPGWNFNEKSPNDDLDQYIRELNELGLTSSRVALERVKDCLTSFGKPGWKQDRLEELAKDFLGRLYDDLAEPRFLAIEAGKRALYEQPEPIFGQVVFEKFPPAREDIEEAGKCVALNRNTAAVFHLMRALECAVQIVADKIGATIKDQHGRGLGWGVIAENMKPLIDAMPKGSAEQLNWYRIQSDLAVVNRAWRVPTNHPKETYTSEQANEVFDATKTFMRELSELV